MRSICWTSAMLSVVGLVGSASGFELGCNHAGTCGSGPWSALCAPACAAPAYGTERGCCESTPSCCDDAWAGYCQERARRLAFWDRFFAEKPHGGRRTTVVYDAPSGQAMYAPAGSTAVPVEAFPSAPSAPVESPQPIPPAEPTIPTELQPPAAAPALEPTIPEPVIPGQTWRWRPFWQR